MTDELPIRFHIWPDQPGAHLFEVTCEIADPDPAGQVFSLPAWIPGSYMLREFAKSVVQVEARAGGNAVAVRKLDKSTWRCAPCAGSLTVRYQVHAWDLSVRGAHLDTTHAYFNGTSVFIKVAGQEHRRHLVDIQPPAGAAYRDWRVATAMARESAHPYGFGRYQAADYQELIDHPVEMGVFTLATFYACGYPHDIVLSGRHRADLDRLCQDLTAICEYQIRFFGEPPPMDRYVFLITVVGNGYGGLEHRASCSLLCSRDDLPRAGQHDMTEKYRTLLGLCSHEYFHTWHVKRIKPAVFAAPDLAVENYTRQLWAFEGITSYYQSLALLRCGLITSEEFLELLAQMATRVWRAPGRFKQTLEESSFDAWIKLYKQDDNAPNALISYYTKGALVALALDLLIRRDTRNARSLDDVMRALWKRYGETGAGVPEDGVERMAEDVSGLDLRAFFERALRSSEELPLADLLAQFGVKMEVRPAESAADVGGRAAKTAPDVLARRAVLGVRLVENGGDAKLQYVYDGGAAQQAGLSPGDVLVAVDGLRATRANLESLVTVYAPGDTVNVHVFRRDELISFSVTLRAAPADTCVFSLLENADGAVRAQRASWLGAT
ncbi:MAG: PDZ domain-containing protein [Pseudomonadota bacterium]